MRYAQTPFQSDLRYVSSPNTLPTASNDVVYHHAYSYLNTQWATNWRSWQITPRVYVTHHAQSLHNRLSADRMKQSNVVIEPILQISRSLNRFAFITFNTAYSRRPIAREHIFSQPVFTSHRTHVSAIPSLELQSTWNASLNLFSNNLEKGTELQLTNSYQNVKGAFFNSMAIDENLFLIQHFYMPQELNRYTSTWKLAKFFNSINTRLEYDGGFDYLRNFNFINQSGMRRNQHYMLRQSLSLRTVLSGPLNFYASGNWVWNQSGSQDQRFQNQMLVLTQRSIWRPSKSWVMNLDWNYHIPALHIPEESYLFSDFNLS
ncbi:MAG: hypothetical protein Q4F57_10295 [Weeksellaceae bacterium]|nr:hypothetical protein [Weeksellaceae bacterium]